MSAGMSAGMSEGDSAGDCAGDSAGALFWRAVRQAGLMLAGLALAACAARPESPAAMPLQPLPLAALPAVPADARPRLALVLGGGGLRGYAHLGVLQALAEAGIQPDLVVGTSAGAVVGAAYAAGNTPEQLLVQARALRVRSLIDFRPGQGGLMRGAHIAGWVDGLVHGRPIEQFPLRFAAVATDLQSGEPRLLLQGPAGAAVLASAAVPGVNVPQAYDGGYLIDGGLSSLVPVRAARALGAQQVIAVDIYCAGPRSDGLGALAVFGRAMQGQNCRLAATETAEADLLIAPAVRVPGLDSEADREAAIEAGYRAARAALQPWLGLRGGAVGGHTPRGLPSRSPDPGAPAA